MMLNRCVFIGRIKEITFYTEDFIIMKIAIENKKDQTDTIITIDLENKMIDKAYLEVRHMVEIKAKAESDDGNSYLFRAESIRVLGGKIDA